MQNTFINQQINIKELSADIPFDQCFIENNEKQIKEFCNFLLSDKRLLLINGFLGSGKTTLTNFVATYLNSNVLTIEYTCFETTVLDDMLLSFFERFRTLTIEGKIEAIKSKINNFTQKINSYFASIKQPIVIIINSYDSILKNNKQDILQFIKHISNIKNAKVIITSRVYNYEEFEDINFENITVLPFKKEIYEKYLKNNGIKNIGVLSNELYKQTKGYYSYLNLSIRIMSIKELSLSKFLEIFSRSGSVNFHDFIIKEALTLVDPVSLHLFRLLAIMRIPIHFNLLKQLDMFNSERIYFFVGNSLLFDIDESIYLPDYFREVVERQIQESVMLKLHKSCIELYNTQLPLKPMERDLRLSRQTMRSEIDYHSLFIPKKPVIPQIKVTNNENTSNKDDSQETKQEKIKKINFIFENETILNDIADSINSYINKKEENILATESSKLTLTELLNSAKSEENNYNYKNAILLYQNALTKKNDDNFDKFLPTIYLKLAENYKKISKWYEALEYLTKAQDYYYNISDIDKVNSIKLDIANIYFISYKTENAEYILNELDRNENLPKELKIKVNIALAKISDNTQDIYNYYKKSIDLIDINTDKSTKSELFYRFGEINNEIDDIQNAIISYKKCIEIPDNNYYSRALSNLAELYDEIGNTNLAMKYYQKSIEQDIKTKNYNGLYTNSRNLAEIFAPKDELQSLSWLFKAKDYAQQLNESYYLTDTCVEISNFYLLRNDFAKAQSFLEEALKYASKDNKESILSKIKYIKGLSHDKT